MTAARADGPTAYYEVRGTHGRRVLRTIAPTPCPYAMLAQVDGVVRSVACTPGQAGWLVRERLIRALQHLYGVLPGDRLPPVRGTRAITVRGRLRAGYSVPVPQEGQA